MKTLKKIVLSLLITVGISSVNLNSMIRNGFLANEHGLTISQELVESTGEFRVNGRGSVRWAHGFGNKASVEDVVNVVFDFVTRGTENLPEFPVLEEGYEVSRDELREEERNGGVTWGLKESMQGRYYDLDNAYGLEDKVSRAYNKVQELNPLERIKTIVDGINFRRAGVISVEILGSGIAIIRLACSAAGEPTSCLEDILGSLALAGITTYEIIRYGRN